MAVSSLRPSTVLRRHRAAVLSAIEAHGVKNPRVFGSVASGQDKPTSDIDILVKVPNGSAWKFVTLRGELEAILGVPVDLVSEGGLKEKHQAVLDQAVAL